MNELFINSLKEKPLIVPSYLFKYYRELNITEEELLLVITIINIGDKIIFDPNIFGDKLPFDKYKIIELIGSLVEKNLLVIKPDNKKKEEYLYMDLFYNKLFNLIIGDVQEEEELSKSNDLYSVFEQELGRTLSPIEVEIIDEWIKDGTSNDMILDALKEAVYNNVRNEG